MTDLVFVSEKLRLPFARLACDRRMKEIVKKARPFLGRTGR